MNEYPRIVAVFTTSKYLGSRIGTAVAMRKDKMSVESDFIRGNTPAMVLAVLRDGPSYGYAIAKEINKRSNDLLRLRQGTLYPALKNLETKGWIVGEWIVEEGSRPRRVYTISEDGSRFLSEMVAAWRGLRQGAGRDLRGNGRGEREVAPQIAINSHCLRNTS